MKLWMRTSGWNNNQKRSLDAAEAEAKANEDEKDYFTLMRINEAVKSSKVIYAMLLENEWATLKKYNINV